MDVSNPAAPVLAGSCSTGRAWDIDVSADGKAAFIATQSSLISIDTTNPVMPAVRGTYQEYSIFSVAVGAHAVFVADQYALLYPNVAGLRAFAFSENLQPELIATVDTAAGFSTRVHIEGSTVFLADHKAGIRVLETNEEGLAKELGRFPTPGMQAFDIHKVGNYAYVADGEKGLLVLAVAEPRTPALVGLYDTPGYAMEVVVRGTMAYVTDQQSGLHIIDISNPSAPVRVGGYDTPGISFGLAVAGNIAYVADQMGGLQIIDCTVPANPTLLAAHASLGGAMDVTLDGHLAYLAVSEMDVEVVDITDPRAPRSLGGLRRNGNGYGVTSDGGFIFLADGQQGLQVFNVQDPANLIPVAVHQPRGISIGVNVVGGRAYLTDAEAGLQILDVSHLSYPAIPRLLSVSLAAPGTALVAWAPNAETDLAGYQVKYWRPGSDTSSMDAGTATSVQIPNLVPGETYYFSVMARASNGRRSLTSAPGTLTVPKTRLLTWDRSIAPGVVGYTVQYTSTAGGSTKLNVGNVTSHVLPWQEAPVSFTVFAQNAAGSYIDFYRTVTSSSATLHIARLIPSATAEFARADSTTGGYWKGMYGKDGFWLASDGAQLGSAATVRVNGASTFVWRSSTNDPVALERSNSSDRFAACWVSATSFELEVAVPPGLQRFVTFYSLDYFGAGRRSQRVDVFDKTTRILLDTHDISHFGAGRYLSWKLQGTAVFRFTCTGMYNAVVSGIFIDETVPAAAADFLGMDQQTRGNWKANYGSLGYAIVGDVTSLSNGASLSSSARQFVWRSAPTEVSTLERAGAGRVAACWVSDTAFTLRLRSGAGGWRKVSIYCLDYFGGNQRKDAIEVIDAATGEVLDEVELSNFAGGVYLCWNINGAVDFRFTRAGLYNAVASALFIDPPHDPVADFLGLDSATQGNWRGEYGTEGYYIVGDSSALPSGVSVSTGAKEFVWRSSTGDTEALQRTASNDRLAACWVSESSFNVQVDVHDGRPRKISFYCLDYFGRNQRAERIEAIDPLTGAILRVIDLSVFGGGKYCSWMVNGRVDFRFTRTGLYNAVASGVFVDPL